MNPALAAQSAPRERSEQLAHIAAVAALARNGEGSLTILEAKAGLGKTTLLRYAGSQLSASNMRVLTGRGSQVERGFPYGIVRQLFERLFTDRALRDQVLVGAASGAFPLLCVADASGSDESLDMSPFPMLHALYWTVANLCDVCPLALLIDDAADADQASLRFISYLTARIVDLPVLILMATRPTQQVAPNDALEELRATEQHHLLDLAPLSAVTVDRIVEDQLGQRPEPAFSAAVIAATGGNPFYLGELLRDIASRQLAPTEANQRWARELGPPVIIRTVLFRLAAMPPGALQLARACAVLGDGARLADCARLCRLPDDDAANAADALVGAGILADGPRLAFAHPILQAAILADFGVNGRARLHAAAAALLAEEGADPRVIGLHILRAEPHGDQRRVDVLRHAARLAGQAGSPSDAADYLRRALVERPEATVEADVLFELGEFEAAVGDLAGLAHLERAIAGTADLRVRTKRVLSLADYLLRAGQVTQALACLDSVRAPVRDLDPALSLTVETERYWIGHLDVRSAPTVRGAVDYLRGFLDGPDSAMRRQLACYLALDATRESSRDDGSAILDKALAAPGLLTFLPAQSTAVSMALMTLGILERYHEFDALADDALAMVGQRGPHLAFLIISTFRAAEWVRRGQLLDAESEAREAIRASTMQGWQHGAPAMTGLLATSLLEQGRTGEASEVIRTSPFDCDDPTDYPMALLTDARGRVRIAEGATRSGLADLLQCGLRMRELGVLNPAMIAWRSHAALAYLEIGQRDEAMATATEELDLASKLGGPIALGASTRVLGLTVGGPAGIALLREAVEILSCTSGRLEQTRALVDLGAALRRGGQPSAAREYLYSGLELAEICHAGEVAEYARVELRASGARPGRRRAGPEALTASEARVARLAVRGLSNIQIAQSLFVSRKTVEKHLANVYRKLNITSRKDLDPARLTNLREDSYAEARSPR